MLFNNPILYHDITKSKKEETQMIVDDYYLLTSEMSSFLLQNKETRKRQVSSQVLDSPAGYPGSGSLVFHADESTRHRAPIRDPRRLSSLNYT